MSERTGWLSDGYDGPATLRAGDECVPVEVRLTGRVEPVDGRYHWGGRIAPSDRAARLRRAAIADVTLEVDGGTPAGARLGEVDPWGGVRVVATGAPPWPWSGPEEHERHTDVAVIGAGFSGLCAAIRLKRRRWPEFLVFEQADDIGGTWRDNSYPGCACDVPSHLYSYSFALNPQWTDTFSGQAEIWAYLRDCVRRFGLEPHLRLGHTVTDATWDQAAGHWRLTTTRGVYTARVLVGAAGPLSEPSTPDIPGLETFSGTVFHSARWPHDHDLTGRNVAVVGTGASAVQIVPEIQPVVGALTLFQRTPAWVVPRRSRRITGFEHAVYRNVPGAQRLMRTGLYWAREVFAIPFLHPRSARLIERMALRHLARQVPDPALRAKLTPRFAFGCKRVLISDDYYPALNRPNATVVTEPIREVRPDGIVTADGVTHPVDTIVLSTGFRVTDPPLAHQIRGRDGRTLAQAWSPSMVAHLGVTVAGFPNLFLLLGPNTGLGHTSVVLMAERQVAYLLAALDHMRRHGVTAVEPTAEAQRRSALRVDAKMRGTVWTTGGCTSWYLDRTGHNSTIWPGFVTGYRLRLARFRVADYETMAEVHDDTIRGATHDIAVAR
jgi:cation diffusion facilitator CzcD-associated flavoprotein CzcO